jgi:uncharacterized membrane protein
LFGKNLSTRFFPVCGKQIIIAAMPVWVLALNYWLHLLATTAWLGGTLVLTLVAWPGLAAADGPLRGDLVRAFERRFRPLANLSLAALLVTGTIQMSGDPHYEGFLRFANSWSLLLLAKHVVFLLMIGVSLIMQWGVKPALDRAALLAREAREDDQTQAALHRRLRRLTAINLIFGVLVLLLTAFLTAL